MNDLHIKIAPYSGWSTGIAGRLAFLFAALLLGGPFFYAVPDSWPKPLEVTLLVFLGVFFLCWCAYFACRFTRIDERQITGGWRIWLLGEFCTRSATWSEVQHTVVRRECKERGSVVLIITNKAGQRYEFSAPLGVGADALYAIHHRFNPSSAHQFS
jgi:hypothetical protein